MAADPTKAVTRDSALDWLDANPDRGALDFAKAQQVLLGASDDQTKKLSARVRKWKSRAVAAGPAPTSPPNLVSLPPPEGQPLPPGMPDPATATPIEVAEWLTEQALLAVAGGGSRTPGYAAVLKRAAESHAELTQMRAAAEPLPDEASSSLDAVCARLTLEITDVPERLLEVCAVEWARRKGYQIEGDERGIPQIVRRAG